MKTIVRCATCGTERKIIRQHNCLRNKFRFKKDFYCGECHRKVKCEFEKDLSGFQSKAWGRE